MFERPTPELVALLKRAGSPNKVEALIAQAEIAKAIETPLRKGILVGNILENIFERMVFDPGSSTEFPLDLLSPGEEADFVAYTNPQHGYIPQKAVEGDYVQIPTYSIAASIDYTLRYAREARWDIVRRCAEILEASFVKKMNDDGWHTILAAAVDRNVMVFDPDAAEVQFTKRLISLMKMVMRRNAGGNSASLRRGKLTDLYMSPEGIEDVRNWTIDQLDDQSRRVIYVAGDGDSSMTNIFGVNLHGLDEFGEGQEYQNYYSSQLGGTLGPNSDAELVIGLDQQNKDSFVMPIKQEVTVFEDGELHRHQRAGLYGWAELGFGVLDTRRVILGSF